MSKTIKRIDKETIVKRVAEIKDFQGNRGSDHVMIMKSHFIFKGNSQVKDFQGNICSDDYKNEKKLASCPVLTLSNVIIPCLNGSSCS